MKTKARCEGAGFGVRGKGHKTRNAKNSTRKARKKSLRGSMAQPTP